AAAGEAEPVDEVAEEGRASARRQGEAPELGAGEVGVEAALARERGLARRGHAPGDDGAGLARRGGEELVAREPRDRQVEVDAVQERPRQPRRVAHELRPRADAGLRVVVEGPPAGAGVAGRDELEPRRER